MDVCAKPTQTSKEDYSVTAQVKSLHFCCTHTQTPTQHGALLEYHHVMFNDTMPLFIYFFRLCVKIWKSFLFIHCAKFNVKCGEIHLQIDRLSSMYFFFLLSALC